MRCAVFGAKHNSRSQYCLLIWLFCWPYFSKSTTNPPSLKKNKEGHLFCDFFKKVLLFLLFEWNFHFFRIAEIFSWSCVFVLHLFKTAAPVALVVEIFCSAVEVFKWRTLIFTEHFSTRIEEAFWKIFLKEAVRVIV